MADVSPDKQVGVAGSDVFEFVFDATDKTTAALQLDPKKDTTVAIKTTGSATVAMDVYLEDPDNAGAVAYPYVAAAATASSVDYVQSTLGPIAAVKFTGTVTGGDGATIQVIQSERK